MKYLSFLGIVLFILAGISLFKDNPPKNSIAESIQLIKFYGCTTIGMVCFVGYIILKQLNSNK